MASRSPSEFFVKFLLSQQKQDHPTILRMLDEYGLDGVNVAYLRRLQNALDADRPDPWDPTSKEGRAYLRKHGIHDLWYPNAAATEAYSILANPNIRASAEQFLLAPLRMEDAAAHLNRRYQTNLTPDGVQAYAHYFWNRSLLTTGEWVEYLETRPLAPQNVSLLRVSPDMAQMLVPWVTGTGAIPATLNTGTVAKHMRDVAFLKVVETEHQPASLPHSKMMKNYMDVIKGSEELLRQSDVALKDVIAAFEQFRMKKDLTTVPSIEQVAGPNYSRSGLGTDKSRDLLEEYDKEDHDDDG